MASTLKPPPGARPRAYVTTSWDDGHPLDLRLADLLARHGLTGTFYVPMRSDRPTLAPAEVRELAQSFEIGAHTLHHVDLLRVDDVSAYQEILDSKAWVEDVTGKPCRMFCFPKGHFARRHLASVARAGYRGARTTELISTDFPRNAGRVALMPTTVHAYPHTLPTYIRNWAKHAAYRNLWTYVTRGRTTDWVALTRALHAHTARHGGVFHLWGHSWEIDDLDQWHRLAVTLRLLADGLAETPCLPNWKVCEDDVRRDTLD